MHFLVPGPDPLKMHFRPFQPPPGSSNSSISSLTDLHFPLPLIWYITSHTLKIVRPHPRGTPISPAREKFSLPHFFRIFDALSKNV